MGMAAEGARIQGYLSIAHRRRQTPSGSALTGVAQAIYTGRVKPAKRRAPRAVGIT